jgi:hypothetical protein
MKPNTPLKKQLTFGDFVVGVYQAWGERKAKGIIQLAVKAGLVEWRGKHRFKVL